MSKKTPVRRIVTASVSAELKRKVSILAAHLGHGFAETLDGLALSAADVELRRAGLKTSNGKVAKS